MTAFLLAGVTAACTLTVGGGVGARVEEEEEEEGMITVFPPFSLRAELCISCRVCARQTWRGVGGGGCGGEWRKKPRLSAERYLPSPVGRLIWFVKYVNNQMINK